MNTKDIAASLGILLSELVDGAPPRAFVLNGGDPGLLGSLDRLSAAEASSSSSAGATIAAHARHVAYGLSLMNRWASGERNPWKDADWQAAWRTTEVNDGEWAGIRHDLSSETHRWLAALQEPRDVNELELSGMIGSVAHVAYHLGAIRQIHAATRGPREGGGA
jgi:hypothetical protein